MIGAIARLATAAAGVFLIVTVIIPTAVQLGNLTTPTGVSTYPFSTPGLLNLRLQGVAWPDSTLIWAVLLLILLAVLIWGISAATGLLHPNGRASIVRLRFYVWWKSRHHRTVPLTGKTAEPLGRVGVIGFFGRRWFTDLLEETRVLIAASGVGKTVRLVLRLLRRATGPVVSTSTKPDVLEATVLIRKNKFPDARVMVFDPEGLVPWMGQDRVKWDIVAGCEDGKMAQKRAAAIVRARPLNESASTNAGFFATAATIVLQCMLHAAAVAGLSMRDVMAWMGDFDDDTPYDILESHPAANHRWKAQLTKYCRGKAEETVSSTDMTTSGILDAFTLDEILDAVCPTPGERVVDIRRHHRTKDTLYLICKGEDSPAASVFTALVESLYRAASDDVTRNGVCYPPMELVLDEALNVCAIPSLPRLMSTGRGEGIIPTIIAQDYSQIEERYGPKQAVTIVNNATQLLVMGGLKDADYLQKLSALAGTLDGLGRGWAKQVLAPEKIRTLWEGRAVMFYRNQRPVIIHLPAWWRTPHRAEYQASKNWAKAQQQAYAAATEVPEPAMENR